MSQGLATGHLFWASLMCCILLVISKIRDLIKFSEQLHKMTQITAFYRPGGESSQGHGNSQVKE